ncbi:hypothetical protein Hdeb2414_s0008g00278271 [Helianthus debilis subsp. tardiflorus]
MYLSLEHHHTTIASYIRYLKPGALAHGSSNEHFNLIFDSNIQINARFIGLRPEGRTRGLYMDPLIFDSNIQINARLILIFYVSTLKLAVTIPDIAEIYVNVIPVSKEDGKLHNYQIPKNESFAHLEVQFRFFGLSANVEGILDRTYRPDFENPAKQGVAMPVVGGDDKYKTSSLLATDCALCVLLISRMDMIR